MNAKRFTQLFLILSLFILGMNLNAQQKGDKNVIIRNREIPSFKALDIGGALSVFIQIAEMQEVRVETDENFQDNVKTQVKDGILSIKSNNIKNPTKLNVYIKMTDLDFIKASGAYGYLLKSQSKSKFYCDLKIIA
jgi:hypothetical protein